MTEQEGSASRSSVGGPSLGPVLDKLDEVLEEQRRTNDLLEGIHEKIDNDDAELVSGYDA